jgi:BMFP domain-containing protein YqiC
VAVQTGKIKVLISRRNKSLTVEMVENQITERIAGMEIEDEVRIMLAQAIEDFNIASSVQPIVNEQLARFDQVLKVSFDNQNNEIIKLSTHIDNLYARLSSLESNMAGLDRAVGRTQNYLGEIDHRISALEKQPGPGLTFAGSGSGTPAFLINSQGLLMTDDHELITKSIPSPQGGDLPAGQAGGQGEGVVEIVDLEALFNVVTATSSGQIGLIVDQRGQGDVADFRYQGVSIVNIADSGKVSVVGEMAVDGRLMVCSGAGCGEALDLAVDETMGDLGVEGTVVAGAFAGYCIDGYTWVSGSAKYGTLPGFCVETNEHEYETNNNESRMPWVNVPQGEAMLTCENMGDGYHLISENEWLTVAENVIRNIDNDCDKETEGLQLAAANTTNPHESETDQTNHECATTSVGFVLSNGNMIYGLAGGAAEWTDQTITKAGLFAPQADDWQEYNMIDDFKGFNITPPYYYTSMNNIGRVKTGLASSSPDYLRGFVRGASALFDLDLSHSPVETNENIGFRCAK